MAYSAVCPKTKYGSQCERSCNCKNDNHCSLYGVCPGHECAPGWKLEVSKNMAACRIGRKNGSTI